MDSGKLRSGPAEERRASWSRNARARLLARLLAFTLAVSLSVALPSAALSQTDATDEARTLFIAGSSLVRAGDWQGAMVQYRASLARKRAPITLFSLAFTEEKVGLLLEARDHYKAFLAEPSTPFIASYHGPAQAALRILEGQIGHIEIVVDPRDIAGVMLAMDGKVPAAEAASYAVNPGQHVLVASAPGRTPTVLTVTVAPGETVHATIHLVEEPSLLPKEAFVEVSASPSSPQSSPARSSVLPVVLVGGGGALFAAGATVGILGIRAANAAPTADGAAAHAARVQMAVGDILGGVGLATAGAGLLILFWPSSDTESAASSARVRPWLGAGEVGVSGVF